MNNSPQHKHGFISIKLTRDLLAWVSFIFCFISLLLPRPIHEHVIGKTLLEKLLIYIRIGEWFSFFQITHPLFAPILPRKIPYQFMRGLFFLFILFLTVIEMIGILFYNATLEMYFQLISSILFVISSALFLRKENNDKSIGDLVKTSLVWMKSNKHKFTIRFSGTPPYKIFISMLFISGVFSILEGCSPKFSGEGGAGVGGAFQALGFWLQGFFLLMMAGWAIIIYKMTTAKSKVINIFSAFTSMTTGIFLVYWILTSLQTENIQIDFQAVTIGVCGIIFILLGLLTLKIVIMDTKTPSN